MEAVARHSVSRASDEAARLWALASAQYPADNALILDTVAASMIEVISAFALNARRALELLPRERFAFEQARWVWSPSAGGEVVGDLWDALNRIIHARELKVGFELLPNDLSVLDSGSRVIPYVQAATDRKALAFVDPFALSHAFLYQVLPKLVIVTAGDTPAGLN